MRRGVWIGIVAAALAAGLAWGADGPTLEAAAAGIESAAAKPDGDRVVVGHLSRKLGLSADVLRQQRTWSGLGWGDVLIANYLAAASRRTFDETVAEHRRCKTWNEIAEGHQVPASELLQYVRESEDAIEERSEDRAVSRSKSGGLTRRAAAGEGAIVAIERRAVAAPPPRGGRA